MKGKASEGEGGRGGRGGREENATLRGFPPHLLRASPPRGAGTLEMGVRLETSRMASATPEGGKPHGCQRHRLAQESASVTTFNRDSRAADLW